MHLAHSTISQVSPPKEAKVKKFHQMSATEQFRYRMQLKGFNRRLKDKDMQAKIAEIREVFPDWVPVFQYRVK